jgi:hypothetical protein
MKRIILIIFLCLIYSFAYGEEFLCSKTTKAKVVYNETNYCCRRIIIQHGGNAFCKIDYISPPRPWVEFIAPYTIIPFEEVE